MQHCARHSLADGRTQFLDEQVEVLAFYTYDQARVGAELSDAQRWLRRAEQIVADAWAWANSGPPATAASG